MLASLLYSKVNVQSKKINVNVLRPKRLTILFKQFRYSKSKCSKFRYLCILFNTQLAKIPPVLLRMGSPAGSHAGTDMIRVSTTQKV